MITVEDFADYVGASSEGDGQADLTRSLAVATTLIDGELTSAYKVPSAVVRDQLILDVAMAVYRRNVNASSESYDGGTPMRAPNDPLQQVRPMLSKYVIYL